MLCETAISFTLMFFLEPLQKLFLLSFNLLNSNS